MNHLKLFFPFVLNISDWFCLNTNFDFLDLVFTFLNLLIEIVDRFLFVADVWKHVRDDGLEDFFLSTNLFEGVCFC